MELLALIHYCATVKYIFVRFTIIYEQMWLYIGGMYLWAGMPKVGPQKFVSWTALLCELHSLSLRMQQLAYLYERLPHIRFQLND